MAAKTQSKRAVKTPKPRKPRARKPRVQKRSGVPELPAAAPGRIVCVYIPIVTRSVLNESGSTKWKSKRDAHVRGKVARIVGPVLEAHGLKHRPCTVVLTRVSVGHLDTDNLAGALKRSRDGVSDAIGIDDGDASITWAVDQIGAPRGVAGVYVEVYEPGAGARELLARGDEWICRNAHALDVVLPLLRK